MTESKNVPIRKQESEQTGGGWSTPDVDIYETGDKLVLLVDVPGASNPDVSIEGDELRIEARSQYSEPEEATRLSAEFEPANFRRVFSLPADVETENVTAEAKDGVLRIELSKAEQAKVRKIKVKAG